MDSHYEAILRISGGDTTNVSDGLKREEATMRRIPLTSDAAEGYHRTARLVHIKASASRMPWVLSSTRLDQNLQMALTMVGSEVGASEFRNDWFTFKNILQFKQGACAMCGGPPWKDEALNRFEMLYCRHASVQHSAKPCRFCVTLTI